MADLHPHRYATIRELGQLLRSGQTTSVELTEFYLKRCETLGREYNCLVTATRKLALEQARRADEELAAGKDRGPLHGIPYGLKDLISVKGYPTTWGATPFRNRVIDENATVFEKLTEAGAVLVAKLSSVVLAGGVGYSSPDNTFSGPQLNPWDKRRYTGGSSSGPGAAVAGGMVAFAIGSETNGSIISPAACCGIAGLRPTYGRVSRHGAMALCWTLDKLGPMCRSAEDCGLVLHAITGRDPKDESTVDRPFSFNTTSTRSSFKFATLKGAVDKVQPGVKIAFERSVKLLAGIGTVTEVELPDLPYGDVINTIFAGEMGTSMQQLLVDGSIWDLRDPESHHRPYAAAMVPASDYLRASRIRVRIQRELDAFMAQFDAVVTPTMAIVAQPSDRPFRDYETGRGKRTNNMGSPANLCGLPGLSIPNGFGEDNMPVGLNLVGRAFDEDVLLAIAAAIEDRTDWHRKHPKI